MAIRAGGRSVNHFSMAFVDGREFRVVVYPNTKLDRCFSAKNPQE
jgi:hypothetical protein